MTLILVAPGTAAAGGTISLDDEELHHLKVRRVQPGAAVAFTDGSGIRGTGRVIPFEGGRWRLEIEAIEQVPPPAALVLGVGAGDRDRFGWLVEKATELGVTRIVPLETERTRGVATGLREGHLEKLRRRAREVLKQCGAAWVPELSAPQSVETFVREADRDGSCWLLEAAAAPPPALDASSPAWALIGPEGGLSDGERIVAVTHGFVPVSAGPFTQRFETAALSAAILIQAARAGAAVHTS